MAIQEYVGAVVLEVDGKEIECVSVSNDSNTGYMPVKTMRRKRTISGYCMGIVTHELSVSVPIPVDGDPLDWWKVFDAKLTIYPVSGNGKRVSYTGCCVQSVSDQYEAEGEARRDLKLFAVESVFGNFSFYSYKKACGQKKTVRGSKNSRRLSNGTPAI